MSNLNINNWPARRSFSLRRATSALLSSPSSLVRCPRQPRDLALARVHVVLPAQVHAQVRTSAGRRPLRSVGLPLLRQQGVVLLVLGGQLPPPELVGDSDEVLAEPHGPPGRPVLGVAEAVVHHGLGAVNEDGATGLRRRRGNKSLIGAQKYFFSVSKIYIGAVPPIPQSIHHLMQNLSNNP